EAQTTLTGQRLLARLRRQETQGALSEPLLDDFFGYAFCTMPYALPRRCLRCTPEKLCARCLAPVPEAGRDVLAVEASDDIRQLYGLARLIGYFPDIAISSPNLTVLPTSPAAVRFARSVLDAGVSARNVACSISLAWFNLLGRVGFNADLELAHAMAFKAWELALRVLKSGDLGPDELDDAMQALDCAATAGEDLPGDKRDGKAFVDLAGRLLGVLDVAPGRLTENSELMAAGIAQIGLVKHYICVTSRNLAKVWDTWDLGMPKKAASARAFKALNRCVEAGSTDLEDRMHIARAWHSMGVLILRNLIAPCNLCRGFEGQVPNAKKANEYWLRAFDGASGPEAAFRAAPHTKAKEWLGKAGPVGDILAGIDAGQDVFDHGTVRGFGARAIATECRVPLDQVEKVLCGLKIDSLENTFRICDRLLATGSFEGPQIMGRALWELEGLGRLRGADASKASSIGYTEDQFRDVLTTLFPSWNVMYGGNKSLPQDVKNELTDDAIEGKHSKDPLKDARWILGDDVGVPQEREDTLARIESALLRYKHLAGNMHVLSGHDKPLSEAGPKEAFWSKLQCLFCGKTAQEAGVERLKRCGGCRSIAVSYCSAACQKADYKGTNGIHGVRSARREGKESECEMIGKAMRGGQMSG
ncbi:hypothetical protein DFJ74DRAFT_727655, partial [Hyaloraphidium curvatum]